MSAIAFSEPDKTVLKRRDEIVERLASLVSSDGLITDRDECRAYETDALAAYRKMPLAVIMRGFFQGRVSSRRGSSFDHRSGGLESRNGRDA